MKKLLIITLPALLLLACQSPSPVVDLQLQWQRGAEKKDFSIRCTNFCREARLLLRAEEVPERDCQRVLGGSETLRASGTIRGRKIDASFAQRNSCQIEQWEILLPLIQKHL